MDRVRCIHCGYEQDAPQAAETGRCIHCDRPLAARGSRDATLKEIFAEPDPPPRLCFSRAEQALAELLSAVPRSESPELVNELLAIEKRGDSLLAFIPFVGPWLMLRSERHTREEKRRLAALSIGLTLVILAVAWSLMSRAADQLASLRGRIRSEM